MHFKVTSVTYTDENGERIMPSDLEASIDMDSQYPDLVVEAPALYYIATMTKHGPSKEAVALRWQEAYNKNATESKARRPARSLNS